MDACNAGITPTQSHKLLSFHLGFMISTFFFLIFPSATSLSFNFTTFEPNNGQISFEGEARYSSDDGIQLTRDVQDKSMDSSWGRAIYKEQLYLWDRTSRNLTDFATNFSFVINSRNKSAYGDGITFFLNGTQLPSNVSGENLGLTMDNVTNTTVITFVAVEFDTFSNKAKRDPVSDHVGIDINSTISVKTVNWSSNIGEGKLNRVSIRYTSSSQNLSVVLITEFMDDKTTSQSLSYKVDLREYLPEFVTIGFSGATGKSVQINNIYSWNFSSTLQPPNPVEPGDGKKTGFVVGLSVGAVVVVCGLGLVWHHLRKKRNNGGEENGTDSDLVMDEDFEKGTGPRKFSFDELALATSNFAEEEKLGEGGFGGVYRGFVRELNSYVAVKRVSRGSKQGMKEYASEVNDYYSKTLCQSRSKYARREARRREKQSEENRGQAAAVFMHTFGALSEVHFIHSIYHFKAQEVKNPMLQTVRDLELKRRSYSHCKQITPKCCEISLLLREFRSLFVQCYGIPPEATRYMPQAGTLRTSRWKPISQPCEFNLLLRKYFAALLSVCEISQTSFSPAKCP
ncbi:L-type lectin-domain containing receptor kinase IX.1 [Vitis vinifera]|uniref:L-type lectin-domain containing receptor kinase IX.1 n=1 Tax=Vitis vinifera TaxID=29760 RepID=A0A438JN35_VITVI|nr:L-type lectin-domain containing receptor kinase IX.1 [Vitis vinifera]